METIETQVARLELKCRKPVENLLAGAYRSIFHGSGIEFDDVRPYQPGDDVRTMDWKVTARTGRPHIKRYIEDREQFIYLLVDVSGSMQRHSDSRKAAVVNELCTSLTLIANVNQDRIGLILFNNGIVTRIRPGKGRRHGRRILQTLLDYTADDLSTDLAKTVDQFLQITRKRAIVFIISDFLVKTPAEALQHLAHQHDTTAIKISSAPLPRSMLKMLAHLKDAESGTIKVSTLQTMDTPKAANLQTAQSSPLDLLNIEVGENSAERLLHFFRQRQRRINDETGGSGPQQTPISR
jgi:uncharacterized protein (DUF58 family)